MAYARAGKKGYESIRKSDEERRAPGAENLRDLFGGEPTIILLDELSIYLRKTRGRDDAAQLTPFLTVLFKAVERAPGAALVFTLAIGKAGIATDAYSDENEFLAGKLAEAESVAARKATLLDPTSERETVQVLRRRLFQSIDQVGAAEVVEAYRALWNTLWRADDASMRLADKGTVLRERPTVIGAPSPTVRPKPSVSGFVNRPLLPASQRR